SGSVPHGSILFGSWEIDVTTVGLQLRLREDAVHVNRGFVVSAVAARVAPDRDMSCPSGLLVQQRMTTRLEARVEAEAELGDDVGPLACVRDELSEHLSRAAALDRQDSAALEAKRHGRVDETLHGVGNRQGDNKKTSGP